MIVGPLMNIIHFRFWVHAGAVNVDAARLQPSRLREPRQAFPRSSIFTEDRRAQSGDATAADDVGSFLEQQLSNTTTTTSLEAGRSHCSRLHVSVLLDDEEMLDAGRQQPKKVVLIYHQNHLIGSVGHVFSPKCGFKQDSSFW